MSSNEEFFRERRPQAVFKHGILKRYPVVFASKAGSQVQDGRAVFLDGYAGRGKYEDGSPGSPLLLAKSADSVSGFRNVTGIYVEENLEDFDCLQHVMADAGRESDPMFAGDLGRHIPAILRLAKGAALFAFLDPFGTALDREQLLNGFLRRHDRGPTEVLLHVSVSSVARLGGVMRKVRTEGRTPTPKEQKSIDHLNRFLGGEWWQDHFANVTRESDVEQATHVALRVAEIYRTGLCDDSGFRSVSMPIRRHPKHLPKYVLVLFTRHGDGIWYFADALGKAGVEWQEAWQAEEAKIRRTKDDLTGLTSLFEIDGPFDPLRYEREHSDQWVQIIEKNIEGLLQKHGSFVATDRVAEVYGAVLGAAWEKHVRRAIKNLHTRHVITNTGVGPKFFREALTPLRPSPELHR